MCWFLVTRRLEVSANKLFIGWNLFTISNTYLHAWNQCTTSLLSIYWICSTLWMFQIRTANSMMKEYHSMIIYSILLWNQVILHLFLQCHFQWLWNHVKLSCVCLLCDIMGLRHKGRIYTEKLIMGSLWGNIKAGFLPSPFLSLFLSLSLLPSLFVTFLCFSAL